MQELQTPRRCVVPARRSSDDHLEKAPRMALLRLGGKEMKHPCDECKELVDKIDGYRKSMGDALHDVIQICDDRLGAYDSIVLSQIRARALNGLNCRPRDWEEKE